MGVKRSKIRESARGQECQIRAPMVCNFNPETTVFAHIGGAGIGIKSNDIHGSFACSDCHDLVDGRVKSETFTDAQVELMFLDGMIRTQLMLIDRGLIITK